MASSSTTNGTPLSVAAHAISPLEQEVLDEYAALLSSLNKFSSVIAKVTDQPTAQILDSLRSLERKTGLVCTLMKASVYSIVLQQEMHDEDVVASRSESAITEDDDDVDERDTQQQPLRRF